MANKKHVVFLIGNFGCGKSSIVRPFMDVGGPVPNTTYSDVPGWLILGSGNGADSLSGTKSVAMAPVLSPEVNELRLISTGVYYAKLVDLDRYSKAGFDITVVKLITSKETNKARILGRKGKWNEATYKGEENHQGSFLTKALLDGHDILEIDNERSPEETRAEFEQILEGIYTHET